MWSKVKIKEKHNAIPDSKVESKIVRIGQTNCIHVGAVDVVQSNVVFEPLRGDSNGVENVKEGVPKPEQNVWRLPKNRSYVEGIPYNVSYAPRDQERCSNEEIMGECCWGN